MKKIAILFTDEQEEILKAVMKKDASSNVVFFLWRLVIAERDRQEAQKYIPRKKVKVSLTKLQDLMLRKLIEKEYFKI